LSSVLTALRKAMAVLRMQAWRRAGPEYKMRPPSEGLDLRLLGYYWGIFGVIALISSAIYRLSFRVLELQDVQLGTLHWLVLVVFTIMMIHSEGYRGFHKNFSPRVVVRAHYLRDNSKPMLSILGPLFCMGYIHATRRRKLTSFGVTGAIVLAVLLVSRAPSPWRGIIDAGVVAGLIAGVISLLWHWVRADFFNQPPQIPADLPQQNH
jgi:hypothetical protein